MMNNEEFKQEFFDEQLQYILEYYSDDINVECLRNIMYITSFYRLLNKDMEYVIHKGQDFWAKQILEQYNKIKEEDQLWFFTDEWQKEEAEANEDIKAGRYTKCKDAQDLFNKLGLTDEDVEDLKIAEGEDDE